MKLFGGCSLIPDEIDEAMKEWNELNQQEEIDGEEEE